MGSRLSPFARALHELASDAVARGLEVSRAASFLDGLTPPHTVERLTAEADAWARVASGLLAVVPLVPDRTGAGATLRVTCGTGALDEPEAPS